MRPHCLEGILAPGAQLHELGMPGRNTGSSSVRHRAYGGHRGGRDPLRPRLQMEIVGPHLEAGGCLGRKGRSRSAGCPGRLSALRTGLFADTDAEEAPGGWVD